MAEANRWDRVLEGRIPEFCVLLGDEEVRLSARWDEIEMRDKKKFKTRHDKLVRLFSDLLSVTGSNRGGAIGVSSRVL